MIHCVTVYWAVCAICFVLYVCKIKDDPELFSYIAWPVCAGLIPLAVLLSYYFGLWDYSLPQYIVWPIIKYGVVFCAIPIGGLIAIGVLLGLMLALLYFVVGSFFFWFSPLVLIYDRKGDQIKIMAELY